MNWYIGQKIVAVKDHSSGRFKKDDVFTIHGLRKGVCSHYKTLIDIGILGVEGRVTCCTKCGVEVDPTPNFWYGETWFAPIQSHPELSETTYEDILQEIEEMEIQTA